MNAKLLRASGTTLPPTRPLAESSNQKLVPTAPTTEIATSKPQEDSLDKYGKVVSEDQLREYTALYERDYEVYTELRARIVETAKRAQQLEKELERTTEGTTEHEVAKKKLVDYHKEFVSSGGRHDKERISQLSSKLTHLKRLILDYRQERKYGANNNVNSASASPNTAASALF